MKRITNLILVASFAMLLNVSTQVSAQVDIIPCNTTISTDSNDIEYLLNPSDNQYYPVRNMVDEIANVSAKNGHDYEFESKFEAKRLAEKNNAQTNNSMARNQSPVPGGAGYGTFYTYDFQTEFVQGTTLSYDIICPTKAGGDVESYLYLTACNRAAKGVEAFISYYKQQDFHFKIYDWARDEDERWQIDLSYSNMQEYLSNKTINGSSHQVVSIQNRTEKVSNTQWRNIVWLWNYETYTYDMVYSYTYNATLADQIDSHYGTWGPIVETFQDSFSVNTNIMGFYLSQLMSKGTNGTWGNWRLLTDDISTICCGIIEW